MNQADINKLPGLKERDLTPCMVCGKPLTHCRSIAFYRVTIERFVIDAAAVQRQVGLGMALGHAGLASIMGPNADMAKRLDLQGPANVCDGCAITGGPVAAIGERLARNDDRIAEAEQLERAREFDSATGAST